MPYDPGQEYEPFEHRMTDGELAVLGEQDGCKELALGTLPSESSDGRGKEARKKR